MSMLASIGLVGSLRFLDERIGDLSLTECRPGQSACWTEARYIKRSLQAHSKRGVSTVLTHTGNYGIAGAFNIQNGARQFFGWEQRGHSCPYASA
jgi:hypothetical protein